MLVLITQMSQTQAYGNYQVFDVQNNTDQFHKSLETEQIVLEGICKDHLVPPPWTGNDTTQFKHFS